MITLQGKFKPEDYIKALYLHLRPKPWFKYIVIALLSLCLVVFVASASSPDSLINAFSIFVPILIFGLFYIFILFVIMPWNVRRIFSQQKTLHSEHTTVISPETIESTSEHGSMKMRLSDFHKYKVGKDMILVYQSQVLFHMFPRRFFASEEDFQTFISYLEANIGRPKR
jgi:hypothetical protein